MDDSESRDDNDFIERIDNALDEMGVEYTRGYDPDGNSGDVDEFDGDASDEVRPGYSYIPERTAQPASAKTKPSILDGIRSFDSSQHNGVQVKEKPTERDI